jgi:hypothetical protein
VRAAGDHRKQGPRHADPLLGAGLLNGAGGLLPGHRGNGTFRSDAPRACADPDICYQPQRYALAEAGARGPYPGSIEAEVSPERLRRFFSKEDSHYRVIDSLCGMIVFARQNVAADPPFSKVDLISCRNLFIYLAPALQKRVITTFHYALNSGGFLVLGGSETVDSFSTLFAAFDQPNRTYVKKTTATRAYPYLLADRPVV